MTATVRPRELSPDQQASLTEADFRRQVRDLARVFGWDLVVYFPSIVTVHERGWPDLVLVRKRDRRLLFVELKSAKGKLSPRQVEILELLGCLDTTHWGCLAHRPTDPRCPECVPLVEVHVFRPGDFEQVREVLR